jgi:hypothetical protein
MTDLYTSLAGRSVLLIEDDCFTATYLGAAIAAAGAVVVGPFVSEAAALEQVDAAVELPAAAVIAAHLPGGFCAALAGTLRDRAVPCIFTGSRSGVSLPTGWEDQEILAKPYASYQVVDAVAASLAPLARDRIRA